MFDKDKSNNNRFELKYFRDEDECEKEETILNYASSNPSVPKIAFNNDIN